MTESTVTTSFSGISDPTNWPPENGLAVGPAYVVTVESSKNRVDKSDGRCRIQ
jgi:hypothetical protein